MRYYDESRIERKIRRQAIWLTAFFVLISSTVALVAFNEEARQLLPEVIQDWIEQPAESNDDLVGPRA